MSFASSFYACALPPSFQKKTGRSRVGRVSLDEISMERRKKVKQAKEVLINKAREDPLQSLEMIGAIQRLGIDYNFQEEIDSVLQSQYKINASMADIEEQDPRDLYEVSLRFRLLRQQGHHVSQDIFNKFMDKRKFKPVLENDVWGLMELYEASKLSTPGEDIVDEAGDFSRKVLNNAWMVNEIDPYSKQTRKRIGNTLKYPYHESLARFTSKDYLSYGLRSSYKWKELIQEIAANDFQILRATHQNEILHVMKWWRELGLAKEVKFARDEMLEWYIWPMVLMEDPSLSMQRVEIIKPLSLTFIMDDIFDVYGELDQLTLFTEAVGRWDIFVAQQLPDYMKACLKSLYEITHEISNNVYREHGWDPIDSFRKQWADLCNAFLLEAKWLSSGYLPKREEYLKNGSISSAGPLLLHHLFFLLGEGINEERVNLINDNPGLISSISKLARLWDDLGGSQETTHYGLDGSYLDCYKNQHRNASIEHIEEHVRLMISDEWKYLNRSILSSNPFSASFTRSCLNSARMMLPMYSNEDSDTLSSIKEYMKSLLVGLPFPT